MFRPAGNECEMEQQQQMPSRYVRKLAPIWYGWERCAGKANGMHVSYKKHTHASLRQGM